MKRNPSQKRAIAHLSGPMMVLAGPGSGKTSVIVERTEYLIRHHKVAAGSVLVVTFSKAAAREMKERFLKQIKSSHTAVTFGTFHGIFYGILKQAYGLSGKNILPEEQKYQILRELTEIHGSDMTREGEFLEELSREISLVKGNRISLEHYYSSCCPDEVFRKIYEDYKKKCRNARMLDFDDMLVCCLELFEQRKDILKAWQQKFQYILVDEFQDINQIQYDIIRLLAKPEDNLFIVGDDDQSIYHFRGAKPEIMLNFMKDYPKAEQVLLDINYRCTKNILGSAVRLISHNTARFDKKLSTPNPEGKKVRTLCFANPREQYLFVMKELQKQLLGGHKLEDSAVLFRTNLEAEGMVNVFMEFHIPFHMKEHLPNIYEHWIARDILSYLGMAHGDMSRKNFLQVMNRPNRYFSRESVYEKVVSFETLRIFYEEKDWMCDRIDTMESQLKMLKMMSPFAAINYIRHGIGYEQYLQEYACYRKIKPEELFEILERLQENARGIETYEQWLGHIEAYGRQLKEQAKLQQEKAEGVTISTLHSVKGLEYPNVYILNINEGNIPYKKAVLEASLEEERRLFYVGMTRAREELTLCYVKKQFEKEKEMSRFLEEVDTDESGYLYYQNS